MLWPSTTSWPFHLVDSRRVIGYSMAWASLRTVELCPHELPKDRADEAPTVAEVLEDSEPSSADCSVSGLDGRRELRVAVLDFEAKRHIGFGISQPQLATPGGMSDHIGDHFGGGQRDILSDGIARLLKPGFHRATRTPWRLRVGGEPVTKIRLAPSVVTHWSRT